MALPPESRGSTKLTVADTHTTITNRSSRLARYWSRISVTRQKVWGSNVDPRSLPLRLRPRGLELVENQLERQVPEGAVDVRVGFIWPACPVGVVVGDAVVPLLDRDVGQLRQPDCHGPLELVEQLGLVSRQGARHLVHDLVVFGVLPLGKIHRVAARDRQRSALIELHGVIRVAVDAATVAEQAADVVAVLET